MWYIGLLHMEARVPERRPLDEAEKGSTEILILAIVEHEPHHGYEIARLIEDRSGGSL